MQVTQHTEVKPPFPFYKKLWAHQMTMFDLGRVHDNFAVFAEPGVGKSLVALTLARRKIHDANTPYKICVITPLITIQNWHREWREGSEFSGDDIVMVLGSGKQREDIIRGAKQARVIIMSYETLIMEKAMQALRLWGPNILIYDESHKIKSMSAKRTKAAVKLSNHPTVKHRYILTGTPILNSPSDVFSQFLAMDCGKTLGTKYGAFMDCFYYNRNAGNAFMKFPDWQLKEGAVEYLTKLIEPVSVSLKKEDCLDLPPLVRKKIYVELSKDQKKFYKEMAKDYVTYFNEQAITAQMALVKLLRLMQITTGFLQTEGQDGNSGISHSIEDNPRTKALSELLEEIVPTGKVIVWANFRHNYKQIREVCEKLGFAYTQVHGEVNEAAKFRAVQDFTENPACKVLIGSAGALGCGVNLTVAPYSIFYSRSFSLEHSIQAEARTYRAGSQMHKQLTRYDIVAKGTVDELIEERLQNKEDISLQVLKELSVKLSNGFV